MSNPFGPEDFDPIDDPFIGQLDPFTEMLNPFQGPTMENPLVPVDFVTPSVFPDLREERVRVMRDFDYMNSLMDQCEKSVEQPLQPGDWRFPDRMGRDLDRAELHMELDPILAPRALKAG